VKTLSAIELAIAEDAARAAKHLREILARYDCVAWVDGTRVNVAVDLQGSSNGPADGCVAAHRHGGDGGAPNPNREYE
jgi:hypothetical protein